MSMGRTESVDRVAPGIVAGPGAEPACLGLDGGDVLAMLHRVDAGAARGTAVLICPPFGWQDACSFRGLRSWGRALAAAGFPSARLVLPSTGDSAGEESDLQAWIDATAASAEWLRQVTGCRRVAAIGIGLGGIIACCAQSGGAPVDDLVLWAVPARGRRLLRELRSLAQIIAALHPEDQAEDSADGADLNLIGYPMRRATADELERLDLAALPAPPVSGRRVLMLGRDGIAADQRLTAHLQSSQAEVELADGGDWADLMANPQQSVAPAQTIALTLDWLERGPDPELEPAVTPSVQRDTLRCGFGDAELTETPLWLEGLHGRIFGVLTEPRTGPAAPVGAVLVGAGAVPHTGPNRSWVTLARRWAAKGVPTLRVDLGGIGESDGEDPELLTDESFNDRTRGTEIGMVLDELQRRGVADRFILGGLCSGAYISQRLAREDDRIRGLMLINMYAFEWSMQLMIERDRWDRLSEELPAGGVRSIDRELLRRALRHARPDRAWRLISRASERQQRHEATRALDALRDRGVETLLVLSGDEPLLNQFQRQGLVSRLSRWPNLTLHEGRSRDHMYRALWYQREIYAAMDAALQRTLDRPANAPR